MSDAWDDRRSALEEEYFKRQEAEALEKLREQMAAESRASAPATGRLSCVKCDGTLAEVTFEGVQLDRCDKCHGVWLDAGELERLTQPERSGWLGRLRQSFAVD